MEEIWKDVVGYEGLYKVNQYGEIWSEYTHKKLSYSLSNCGYKQYNLHKNGKNYIMTAHKAVALAFVPNPDNLPIINHKDENKLNCFYKNLEWCTHSYNNSYNDKCKKIAERYSKTVYKYDVNGELIDVYKSAREAARENGAASGNMSTCCKNNKININSIYTIGGYAYSFIELDKDEVVKRFNFNNKYRH